MLGGVAFAVVLCLQAARLEARALLSSTAQAEIKADEHTTAAALQK